MFNVFFLEKIVSETDMVYKTDSKMRKLLLQSLLSKHGGKKKYPTHYLGFPYWSVLSAIVTILKCEDAINNDILENADYKSLKERGICYTPEFEATIVSITAKRLEE